MTFRPPFSTNKHSMSPCNIKINRVRKRRSLSHLYVLLSNQNSSFLSIFFLIRRRPPQNNFKHLPKKSRESFINFLCPQKACPKKHSPFLFLEICTDKCQNFSKKTLTSCSVLATYAAKSCDLTSRNILKQETKTRIFLLEKFVQKRKKKNSKKNHLKRKKNSGKTRQAKQTSHHCTGKLGSKFIS